MPTRELSDQMIDVARQNVDADPQVRVASNAVTRVGLDEVARDRQKAVAASQDMSVQIDDWKVTNQKKSGRCWLFASLNLMRPAAMEKMNLKDFEFSQSYALFWEKFERSNYFLQSMIDLADQPLDSRTVQFLLSDVLSDGGQWDMLVSLFTRHGVVPQKVMPETQASSDTGRMNAELKLLLRRSALELRDISQAEGVEAAMERKEQVLSQVYQILVINLGQPPKSFTWQWRDDEKQFHSDGEMTPQQFFRKYVEADLENYVCLVDDPRRIHEKGSTLTVDYLGNVVGGRPVLYLNVDVELMKELAVKTLKSGEPVWFGCDVGQQSDRKAGLLVDGIYDYSSVLGVDLSSTKEQRVLSGESMMTHAMALVGVDEVDGRPVRWRVENSWGDEVGDKGFFTMDDDWFTEYVFEVVVKRSELPSALQEALDQEPLVLPAWDPMGALAR